MILKLDELLCEKANKGSKDSNDRASVARWLIVLALDYFSRQSVTTKLVWEPQEPRLAESNRSM